jgi:hypothetical protein
MAVLTVTGREPTYVVVALDDQAMTLPAWDVASHLCALFDEGVSTVLVDVTRLRVLSSHVVAALLSARREATSRGDRLVLHSATSRGAAMVARSALAGVFELSVGSQPSPWRHP